MSYQMSIFELLETPKAPEWQEMSLKELAAYVSKETGLNFIPDTRFHGEFNEYIAYRTNRFFFTLGIDRYAVNDYLNGEAFISVGYEDKQNQAGGGAPCDTLEDAIEWFKYRLRRPEIGVST